MKRKHSKYRKIWLLWVALEGLVATFAIMSSFLLLRYLYFSNGTAIPEASVSTAGSVLSAVYLPLLITLILTTGFLEHKPCTPAGVMEMLREYGISPAGKRCVVLGRSNIVGKPMAALLTQADGTVTLCHSKTPDLADITRQADILVSAVGKVNCVTADMVKDGAVVIDVAMNRNEAGKLCGDVDFAAVEPKASYITPVPGGVGPMTRAMLMRNILTAAEAHLK